MVSTEILEIARTSTNETPFSRRVAIGGSALTHALVVIFGIWLSTLPRSLVSLEQPRNQRFNLVWLASPGPGGGGGGGGNQTKMAAPARQVGRDRLTAPKARPQPAAVEKPKELPPIQPLTIPAQPMAAATEIAPGVAADPTPAAAPTQGPGSGGGAGTGTGAGSGEGQGSGLGPGFGGGVGGGAYRPGSGVSMPELVREVKPNCVSLPAPNPNGCYVMVYDRADFKGVGDVFNGPGRWPRLQRLAQTNEASWRNRIRSLHVGSGATATVYLDEAFKGESQRFSPSTARACLEAGFSGRIESLDIACPHTGGAHSVTPDR